MARTCEKQKPKVKILLKQKTESQEHKHEAEVMNSRRGFNRRRDKEYGIRTQSGIRLAFDI